MGRALLWSHVRLQRGVSQHACLARHGILLRFLPAHGLWYRSPVPAPDELSTTVGLARTRVQIWFALAFSVSDDTLSAGSCRALRRPNAAGFLLFRDAPWMQHLNRRLSTNARLPSLRP